MRPMDSAFAAELERLGPGRPHAPFDLARARAYCRRLTLGHYENFAVASLLLPRRLIRHFHAVYAYCRWADDLADEAGGGDQALDLLRWWRDQLLACYGGRPSHPVFVALQPTIERFRIPPRPFLDLLAAFEQDQVVKRYRTFDQLLDYCRCSANPVGRLVLYLGGAFDETRAALSDHVCTALQLANFWQDVSRDFDIGRVYLPEEDRRRFGYGDDDLEGRRFTPAFAQLMRFEIGRTRELFGAAGRCWKWSPPSCASTWSCSCAAGWRCWTRSSAAATTCGRGGRWCPNGIRLLSWPAPSGSVSARPPASGDGAMA